jgi:hypothetical protein
MTHDFTHDTRLLTHDTRHVGTLADIYGVKYTFRLFQRHNRVLPNWVKRGYGLKYTFRVFRPSLKGGTGNL